jgi:hypothetical protein
MITDSKTFQVSNQNLDIRAENEGKFLESGSIRAYAAGEGNGIAANQLREPLEAAPGSLAARVAGR